MINIIRKIFAFFLALALILSLSVSAFAADSTITFNGEREGFDFQPGSVYTETDLFDSFKHVMPGDRLTENIQIIDNARDCDYTKFYMKAVVHDENGNPLSDKVAEDETVASMQDFLSQLTMRVYNGDKLIYDASPDEAGALAKNVFLGQLHKGESLDLTVELDVPIELGNKYANRVGEVDWVFLAECYIQENLTGQLTVHKIWDDGHNPERPDSVTVYLMKDGKKHDTVKLSAENQWTYTWDELDKESQWSVEENVPDGYDATYETEDNNVFITNYKYYEIPAEPLPETIFDVETLTVKKVWDDENDKRGKRPNSVVVTLYNGKKTVEKVTLNQKNNWTYQWTNLDASGDWSVLETAVPKGYTPSYRTSGNVVKITNTATLIQTGQHNLPILILGGLGVLMMFCGILMIRRKKVNGND